MPWISLALLFPVASLILSIVVFTLISQGHAPWIITLFQWSSMRDFHLDVALRIDALSSLMMLIITGIGTLIHIYSLGYMHGDRGIRRYFFYLNLFLAFMLLLVTANNLFLLFVGWEGVGLCSYFLIGFWFEEAINAKAGKKAFVVNRIGDAFFMIGMIILMTTFGTLDLDAISTGIRSSSMTPATLTLISLLLFAGATGKSAQIPLHVWLPDAMQGPTPVSALIHAATMVTAGIYLIVRLSGLFVASPTAMLIIAVVGSATALLAATVATSQNDIKKILAYSTISQLGLMFAALGVGAFSISMFHLFTHAFFKALLFLGAGAIIHALHGEQSIFQMGGLAKRQPLIATTFMIAGLSLMGLPPFSGFFSKDAILGALQSEHPIVFAMGLATSFFTAIYTTRLLYYVFFAPSTSRDAHHPTPFSMSSILVLLAIFTFASGWAHAPFFNFLSHSNMDLITFARAHEGGSVWPILLATVLGILFSVYLLSRPRRPWSLLAQHYFDDALADRLISRPLQWISDRFLFRFVDRLLCDRIFYWTAYSMKASSLLLSRIQTGQLSFYILTVGTGLLGLLIWSVCHG